MSTLQQPVRIGAWELPNRLVMAPLTRCRASDGRVPNALMAEYYRQRSSAGLILAEATSISPQGVGYPDTPGLWSDEQVAGWRLVTDAVHAAGGRIIAQLWHVGRVSDPHYLDGAQPVSSSDLPAKGHVSLLRPQKPYDAPRPLELAEIPGIIADYRRAAENALAAGFDGVEIHGANGYLPHQFLNDGINKRQDSYGGSIENRARFMLEAVDAAIAVWGPDRVGLHLSPDAGDDSDPAATYGHVARECSARGIAFLFVRESLQAEPRFSKGLRDAFNGAFIANQELSREAGERLVESGEADAVSYGRLFIANPDLVERFAAGAPLNEPDPSTFYGGTEKGYTDYPTLETTAV
ncbi:alkene reductase [Luteolibacter marinus]|uniref:alkene reductase n=1 Tax=Luteolibacter marinus TaxID=2776705 RepID=UPI0018683452|nr:alkene reductase [Luteolibacter marinus]